MRSNLRKPMTLSVFAVGITVSAQAQSNVPNSAPSDLAAKSDQPQPAADKGTGPPASSSASKQELKPTVEQEIEALKKRIDQLESEVKEAKAAVLADSSDSAALKAAEKNLVAGSGAGPTSSSALPTPSTPVSARRPVDRSQRQGRQALQLPRRSVHRQRLKVSPSKATGRG